VTRRLQPALRKGSNDWLLIRIQPSVQKQVTGLVSVGSPKSSRATSIVATCAKGVVT
jgi:hypothetical protein